MLRHAVRADLPAVVDTWLDAFSGDPFFRWIAPDDETWGRFGQAWLSFIGGLCFERGHTFLADQVAIAWIPPDLALVGPEDIARGRDLIAAHAGEQCADQALSAILEARGHAMEEPHWTLQYVGVRSAAQGSGLGAAVAEAGLTVVDRDGLPCGLTSTNPRNVSFYERLGFERVAEVAAAGGAATLTPMARAPRPH